MDHNDDLLTGLGAEVDFSKPLVTLPTKSPISKILEWRAQNPEKHRAAQVAGLRRSVKLRAHLAKLQRGEIKRKWITSLLSNPKFGRSEENLASKWWRFVDPQGNLHRVKNLRNFIRKQAHLLEAADVHWKGGETQWCHAYQSLARLRPGVSRMLQEWKGWRWAGTDF